MVDDMIGANSKQIVISIQPKWAGLIRSGEKTVELRRRFPRLPAGAVAYLYESTPTRAVTALLHLGIVQELPVAELWISHGKASCVDQDYFNQYFAGRDVGFGIHITRCVPLSANLPLAELRQRFAFIAPQSWAYATPELIAAARVFP